MTQEERKEQTQIAVETTVQEDYGDLIPDFAIQGIENLLNAIQLGILTASTKDRLDTLEQQREALKQSIFQAQMERPKYNKDQIVDWIGRFKSGNIHDEAYRKQIIDIFVNSVYVYDDHFIFIYNFKDGAQTLTLQEIESTVSSDITNASPPRKIPLLSVGQKRDFSS